jgi:hypothetical protein
MAALRRVQLAPPSASFNRSCSCGAENNEAERVDWGRARWLARGEPQKAPVEGFVTDRAEKPSENWAECALLSRSRLPRPAHWFLLKSPPERYARSERYSDQASPRNSDRPAPHVVARMTHPEPSRVSFRARRSANPSFVRLVNRAFRLKAMRASPSKLTPDAVPPWGRPSSRGGPLKDQPPATRWL